MNNPKIRFGGTLLLIFTFYLLPFTSYSQVRPVYDYGAIGLGQLLKKLNTTASAMQIGAHPDDESSELLAYLARGENARTAYLSLTRGDGGQNLIGAELFESLGVIRTEELLQARRLDGAEQFFTRAFDYGFSKTLAEAKEKWDEKVILCDAVRAIRAFRPFVVISRYTGTPADGHGQHQFAGYIAPLAVKAAADTNQCKDAGEPWRVLKFYVSQNSRSTEKPTLSINTGQYDFLLGRSYFEIAMEGRSQHKTQEQGVLEPKGARFLGLNLIESGVPNVQMETSVFDGIDVSSKSLSPEIADFAGRAWREYSPANPQKIVSSLVEGWKAVGAAQSSLFMSSVFENSDVPFLENTDLKAKQARFDAQFLATVKASEFIEAIRLASGIQIDALADRETVAPDENFLAAVKVFFPNAENIKVKEIALKTPNGWTISKAEEPKDANQNPFRRENANYSSFFDVKVPASAPPTEPYWLENPRRGFLYDWKRDANQTLPFQPPLVSADVKVEIDGTEIIFNQPVEYRFADDIRGEIRRDLNVVPKISLSLDQKLLIIPQSNKQQAREIVLSITNNSSEKLSGEAKLNVPENWISSKHRETRFTQFGGRLGINYKFEKINSVSVPFSFKNKGEKTTVSFDILIPANVKISDFNIGAQAVTGGETFTKEMNTLAYPHIRTHRFYTRAETRVEVLDLKTVPVKIGYIMGSGDRVAEAIRQMNFDLQMLGENDLTNGDLSRFDVIVVGIRASQVRPDFIANHQRLLDYVKNGGTMIVQYQLPVYQNLLPFPAKMDARVTDENAKVAILEPTNPIFNFPNKITDADFAGWVQERNLYAFSTFDANYKPLLESHDAGEAENKGGLTVAPLGKGFYIYNSYSFFRQLPAGVPGAYRLLANLLNFPKAGK